jgi:hypothetical protein
MPTPRKTKTKKSSSRTMAQRAGASDKVLPGRRNKAKHPPIIDGEHEEVFGVLLSERRRRGEAIPTVPEEKIKTSPRSGGASKRRPT